MITQEVWIRVYCAAIANGRTLDEGYNIAEIVVYRFKNKFKDEIKRDLSRDDPPL